MLLTQAYFYTRVKDCYRSAFTLTVNIESPSPKLFRRTDTHYIHTRRCSRGHEKSLMGNFNQDLLRLIRDRLHRVDITNRELLDVSRPRWREYHGSEMARDRDCRLTLFFQEGTNSMMHSRSACERHYRRF